MYEPWPRRAVVSGGLFGPLPDPPGFGQMGGGDFDDPEPASVRVTSENELQRRWGQPPFSILSQRDGEWQKRKRAWLALGIESHLGRAQNLQPTGKNSVYSRQHAGYKARDEARRFNGYQQGYHHLGQAAAYQEHYKTGRPLDEIYAESEASGALADSTSVFDPYLAELCYSWFCPRRGVILDPFAGGSVRGVVAGYMGYPYIGVDLRQEQVTENERQRAALWAGLSVAERSAKPEPEWITGNSRFLQEQPGVEMADMVYSCPPYYDLEVYSDDPEDLSNLPSYEQFAAEYAEAITAACRWLKDDRFAAFVVGDIRDKRTGMYYGFVGDTISAFREAGLGFYNHAVIVGPTGSAALRAGGIFGRGRKLVKTHQDLLVFCKGDPRVAADAIPEYTRLDLGDEVNQMVLSV